MLRHVVFGFFVGAALFSALPFDLAAQSTRNSPNALVAEATAGAMKATSGRTFDKDCGEQVDYQADLVDLNQDGQPEVFVTLTSSCYGMTGSQLRLYGKGKDGIWRRHLDVPASEYKVLGQKSLGFSEIQLAGRGACRPTWRWDGNNYKLAKKC